MRSLVLCLALLIAVAKPAHAGPIDWGMLSGLAGADVRSPIQYRWSGLYFGGTLGLNIAHIDFSQATSSLVEFALRESTLENGGQVSQWDMLKAQDVRGQSYGGFIGYNQQWEELVLGLELNYNFGSISGNDTQTLSRGVSPGDGLIYHTTVTSAASLQITDYGTIRARAGWVYGRILPYAMVSLAGARANVTRSATVSGYTSDPNGIQPDTPFGPFVQSEAKSAFVFGYGAGVGVDISVMPNVFVRGEYEYVQFTKSSDITTGVSALRVGAGIKF